MLPKYLPPPHDSHFDDSLQRKKKDGLSLREAFEFVHAAIAKHEARGDEPLEALQKTYLEICAP